ncbi:MAG: hypothetical protein ACYC0F_11700 [Rhodanobacter sp.]
MNVPLWLQIPWRSAHRSLRWSAIALFTLCTAGALAVGLFAEKPGEWDGAVALYGAGLFYLWAFFLPLSLLLAIDARQMRMPGMQPQIAASLATYGLLGIALPVAVLALSGLPVFAPTVLLVLLGISGLTFALMPRYLAVLIGMTPALVNALWRRFDLPGLGDPHFIDGALALALFLLLVCAWRWRQLLLAGSGQPQGWSSPMVLQFRSGSWGYWNHIGDQRQLRQRPDWLQPTVDLDGAGPATPRKALRVVLGGWYLPQTARSYARQLGLLLAIIALPLLGIVLLRQLGRHDEAVADLVKGSLIGSLGSLCVIAGPMICALSLLWLRKRWQAANGELSLLALLPGMGDAARARQLLVRTGLGLPLRLHAVLMLLIGVAMLCWRGHAAMLSFLLLAQFGATAVTAATLLNLLGGRALGIWSTGLVLTTSFVLTLLSLLLPALAWGRHPVTGMASWLPLLTAGWLLLGAAMIWLGRRGWHELMQRPHPFLIH